MLLVVGHQHCAGSERVRGDHHIDLADWFAAADELMAGERPLMM